MCGTVCFFACDKSTFVESSIIASSVLVCAAIGGLAVRFKYSYICRPVISNFLQVMSQTQIKFDFGMVDHTGAMVLLA